MIYKIYKTYKIYKKKAGTLSSLGFTKAAITYSPAFAVPSALQGLTSLFGMGRGGALVLSSPEYLERALTAEAARRHILRNFLRR